VTLQLRRQLNGPSIRLDRASMPLRMRWTLWIAVVLLVVLSAYAVWPVIGFYKIASAVEFRDAAALTQRVDFRSLRKSLTKQLVATYLELTGQEKKLGLLEKSIAMGVGDSIADPIVARLVDADPAWPADQRQCRRVRQRVTRTRPLFHVCVARWLANLVGFEV
jgi:hypothetical protein